MRKIMALFVLLTVTSVTSAGGITGEYVEARNADVWTGPCFANGEMGIVGNKAILAWKVDRGSFKDVDLDGLSVVAVVIGDKTFGINCNVKTRTAFIVDEDASAVQREALIAMARDLASPTIQDVVSVKAAKISIKTNRCEGTGCALVDAGDARVETRCLGHQDSICGHEEISYPTLAKVDEYHAAFSLVNQYSGENLGETFRDSNARSAILAKFAL